MPSADNQDDLARAGLAIGLGAMLLGLCLGMTGYLRSTSLWVDGTVASTPMVLQAQIQLSAGCLAILAALLWITLRRDAASIQRLRPLVQATIVLCGISALTRAGANWAIVTGRLPDYCALIPVVCELLAALSYAAVVYPLSGVIGVSISARLLMRSSAWWLGAATIGRLVCVVARVLLGRSDALWFLDRPLVEVGLLGFALLGGMGLMLAALPSLSGDRNLIQAVIRTHQVLNGLIAAWAILQAWSLRYPGSYQTIALALGGTGILICVVYISAHAGLRAQWRLASSGPPAPGDEREVLLAAAAFVFAVLGGASFALTAFLGAAAKHSAAEEPLAAAVLAVGVGMISVIATAVARLRIVWEGPMVTTGTSLIVAGVVLATPLWVLSLVVEGSLRAPVAVGEILVALGLAVLTVAALFSRPAAPHPSAAP